MRPGLRQSGSQRNHTADQATELESAYTWPAIGRRISACAAYRLRVREGAPFVLNLTRCALPRLCLYRHHVPVSGADHPRSTWPDRPRLLRSEIQAWRPPVPVLRDCELRCKRSAHHPPVTATVPNHMVCDGPQPSREGGDWRGVTGPLATGSCDGSGGGERSPEPSDVRVNDERWPGAIAPRRRALGPGQHRHDGGVAPQPAALGIETRAHRSRGARHRVDSTAHEPTGTTA
jgi:hypothetical protein